MLLLHCVYQTPNLFIWAEQSGAETVGKDKHPFAASAQSLAELFDRQLDPCEVTIWLPSNGRAPYPSSELVGDSTHTGTERLSAWSVDALRLPVSDAMQFLLLIGEKRLLSPGVVIGTDLAFWCTSARFALSLIVRQRYLPSVMQNEGRYVSGWEPVFWEEDAELLKQLVRAMPPSCVGVVEGNKAPKHFVPALHILKFTSNVIDSFMREGRGDAVRRPNAGKMPALRSREITSATKTIGAGVTVLPSETPGASVHDNWIKSLSAWDPTIYGPSDQLSRLHFDSSDWKRPLSILIRSPYRLCFRLEEPILEDELDQDLVQALDIPQSWYLRFLLQSHDDPSLLLPVANVWNSTGNLREFLLASFGSAAQLFPQLEAALEEPVPTALEMDLQQAYHFMTNQSWLLQHAGFGVLLPSWWTKRRSPLALRARVNKWAPLKGHSHLSLDTIIDFEWQVALGDTDMTERELRQLARLKIPLVRVRGRWAEVNPEEVQSVLNFWTKKKDKKITLRDAVKLSLTGTTVEGLPVADVSGSDALNELVDKLRGLSELENIAVPNDFNGVLRPYQVRGYSWLHFLQQWQLGACLADDMGLGKTIQSLALLQKNWLDKPARDRRPSLLVCPMSVIGNWQKEAQKFTPNLPVYVHHGTKRKRKDAFIKEVSKNAIVVCSYQLLMREQDLFNSLHWSAVILDEAQNIKNPITKQSMAARSLQADFKLALTGTPVENHVGELWSIMDFLNPGLLGDLRDFKDNFFKPIQDFRDQHAMSLLKQLTGPFILRRLKTDKNVISDLPEKMEMKVFCNLTREQATLYEAVVKRLEEDLKTHEGPHRAGLILGALSHMKQVCNHPAQFLKDNSSIPGRSGKLARLTEMLEELAQIQDRVLIFSQFAEMGSLIKTHLQETLGEEVLFLHGEVSKVKREAMIERFQNDENGPLFFMLSLKAGGTGLNLTRASHVFHFDRWWNPAVEDQATDRAYRIGQTKNVQVHKFVCIGTLEEKIDEMIESKKNVAGSIVSAGENWLTQMSNEELKNLFRLRPEAFEE